MGPFRSRLAEQRFDGLLDKSSDLIIEAINSLTEMCAHSAALPRYLMMLLKRKHIYRYDNRWLCPCTARNL